MSMQLAMGFERVCGNKGNSWDTHFIGRQALRRTNTTFIDLGLEDCDYISHEVNPSWWRKQFAAWPIPVELHVPCRDPVDHLMSSCNYHHVTFDCDKEMIPQVDKCKFADVRYSDTLQNAKNLQVKCYSFDSEFTGYKKYMSQRLQHRRIPGKDVPRVSFYTAGIKVRDPETECIWSPKYAGLKKAVKQYLLQHDTYYQYCERCIGSKDDLLLK